MSNFKIATKDDVKNAGFVFVKDVNTQEVKKIATSADFQVGLSNLPKDLTVTGKATFTQGLSGSLTRLTDGTSYLVAGNNVTITSASNGQITITGATLAPVDATYVVFSSNSTLTSERIITAGSGITITDGGAGGNLTIAATGGGSGDVVGPASATDNAVVRFDLTTGKLIQNSVVTIADTTGNITTPGDIAINGGDLTTTAATMNLVNDATTINLGSTAITRAINIGTNATNVQTINIGTGAAANIISVGSATGAASLTLQSGTGGINVGTSNVARTINIGSDPAGTATTQQTINIGAKNTALGGFNAVNIADEDSHSGHVVNIISSNGTQTTGTSAIQIGTVVADCTVTIGSTTDYSITTLNGGTGGVNINSTHATLADAIIGNATVGAHPDSAYTSFAIFGHSSYDYDAAPGSYALLAVGSTGTKNTWLNAPSGAQIRFANNDVSIGYMDDNEVSLTGKASTATTLTLGNTAGASSATIDAGTGNINIGTSNSVRTINVGTGAAVQTINLGTSATANIISVGSNAAQSIGINGGSVLNLLTNAGTTTIDSGGVSSTGIINIGIFGYAQTISIGNTTGATSLLLQAGTGNIALSGGNSTTYTIGTSSTTGTITVGQSTDTNTINIGNGATASTKTQTINVGNSTASGGITNINIGAASNGTNTITIGKFGGGLVNVILGGDDVQIGDSASSDVGFFGTTPQPKTSVTDITNSVTSGGTANTLSNYTSLTTYSTDAAAIRGNFYQIGLKLNAIIDALQSYGLI